MATGRAKGIRAGRAYVEVTGDDTKLVVALRRAQARIKAFGASVEQLGRKMGAAGLVGAVPFTLSARTFATFEQAMARVQALTGASGQDFDRLAARARELGETTVFSASQAAEAMATLALAGLKAEQILAAIGPTLDMAAAGQMGVAEAADIATKVMFGMDIEATRLGGVIDVLTKAMTTANTDMRMLGDALKYVGPIAKAAGISLEEIVAAIQLLSNAGIQGDMAGTSLRGALLSLTNPSKEAAEAMAALGIRVADAQGNVRSLADIIADLERATAGMGSAERLEVLGTMFDSRQAAGMAELLAQGSARLREFTAALEGSAGTAARIAGIQLNTLSGAATILKSALEGLAISIGDAIVAPLRVGIHLVTRFVGALSSWVKAHKVLVATVAASVVAIGAIGGALLVVGVGVKVAVFALSGLIASLTAVKVALGLLLSPAALVAAGVAGVGVAALAASGKLSQAVQWMRGSIAGLGERVATVMDGVRAAITGGDLELATRIMWLAINVAWLDGTRGIKETWEAARVAITKSMMGMVQEVYGLWKGVAYAIGAIWAQQQHAAPPVARFAINAMAGPLGDQLQALDNVMAALAHVESKLDQAHVARRDAIASEIDQARKELEEAIRKAEEMREAARAGFADDNGLGSKIQALLDDVGGRISSQIEVFGAFGGARLDQAFGGNATLLSSQLEQAKKTAQNTAQIAQGISRLEARLAFG